MFVLAVDEINDFKDVPYQNIFKTRLKDESWNYWSRSYGRGMSRRMIKAGIEVHGYRNNYEKNCKQFEAGYISGCTTSLENLVQVVHNGTGVFGDSSRSPGIFMMVVPAETVEDTLNEHYSFVWRAILLLIMAIVILKTSQTGGTTCKIGYPIY
ncbi:MAG: hypothetical protein CM15mV3_0840 [Caudoviricetes sp.]|nr:MAG: hypothetical protein CM15mV3_0840 [Caudoviricetes sp.]